MPPKSIQPDTLFITVNDARVKGDEAQFTIAIMDPMRPRMAIHSVNRTIQQLKPIMRKLSEIHPEALLPEVSSKMFGALESEYVELQRGQIENYLNAVAGSKLLCYDVDFLWFVGYDSAAKERMLRSYLLLELNHSLTLRSCFAKLMYQQPNDERSMAAARCWLRGRDDFVYVRTLPSLTHPSWPCRKTSILVEDTSNRRYIMTVQTIRSFSVLSGGSPDKVKRVRQMMQRANPLVFAPLTELDVVEDKLIAVRPLYPAGSLYDLAFDASSPLSGDKFSPTSRGISATRLNQTAREVFRIIRACHAFGFGVPNLSMGNLLVTLVEGSVRLCLSGFEDVLAGNSWLPLQSVRPSAADSIPTRTHIDILLFGAVLYQAACGDVLSPESMERLLMCQGEVFAEREVLATDVVIAPQHHPLATSMLSGIAPEAANLLHYVFHPSLAADIRVLEHHALLRAETAIVETSDGLYAAPSNEVSLSIKKRDLEVIMDQVRCTEDEHDSRKQKRELYEREFASFVNRDPGVSAIIEKRQGKKQKEEARRQAEQLALIPPPEPMVAPPPPPPISVAVTPQPPAMPDFAAASPLPPPPPVLLVSGAYAEPNHVFVDTTAPLPPPPKPRPPPPPPPPADKDSEDDDDDDL